MRRLLLLLAAVSALAGCGYGSHSLYRSDIRSVYIAFFDNDTFRRQLEVSMQRAIVDEVKLRTPLIIAPRREADSILEGTVLAADVGTQIKSARDEVLLQRATVKVQFRWRDRLTGRDIVPEQTVTETARVPVMFQEGRFGPFADPAADITVFDLALQEAAIRIVDNMQQGW